MYLPDHLGEQWGPLVAATVAVEATTELNVGILVFDNDFRHPVVLAKELATLDLVAEGRFEFGLGAGWMHTDYATSGIAYDEPKVRIDRMEEALGIFEQLFSGATVTTSGTHYQVTDAVLQPTPHTTGGPKLVIGGGSKRILQLAARRAQVVSMVPSLKAGVIGPEMAAGGVAERYAERTDWVRAAAPERFASLELQCWTAFAAITDEAAATFEALAPGFGLTPAQLQAAPVALCGTVDEVCAQLEERRERFGLSYIVLHEGEFESFAPVIARLAGN